MSIGASGWGVTRFTYTRGLVEDIAGLLHLNSNKIAPVFEITFARTRKDPSCLVRLIEEVAGTLALGTKPDEIWDKWMETHGGEKYHDRFTRTT